MSSSSGRSSTHPRPRSFVHEPQAPVGVLCTGARGVVQIRKRIRARRSRVASVRSRVVTLCAAAAAPSSLTAPRRGVSTGMRHERAPSHRRVRLRIPTRVPRVRAGGYEMHVRVLAVIFQTLRRKVNRFRRRDAAERNHAAHAVSRPVRMGMGTGLVRWVGTKMGRGG